MLRWEVDECHGAVMNAAHLRKDTGPAGQWWKPSPLDEWPHVSGKHGCFLSHVWSGSDGRGGGGSLEVVFRGWQREPCPPPEGSVVSRLPSAQHTQGLVWWMPRRGLLSGMGCLPESGFRRACAELGPRWLACVPPGS